MKHDKKGRSKTSRFARLDHSVLSSPAYRSLSPNARALLVELAMMENSKNNGELFLSVRDAAARMGVVDYHAVVSAFNELEGMGFIACTKEGHFAVKAGSGSRARCWRITWQSTPSLKMAPTHEYQTRRPEPGSRANKRMAAGCDALKRYAKEAAKNNLPVVDSTTLPGKRVVESTTAGGSDRDENPVSVVESTTQLSGNGGKASKPFVVESTTHTALPAIPDARQPLASVHPKDREASGVSTPSRDCERCGAPFELTRSDRAHPRRFCSERNDEMTKKRELKVILLAGVALAGTPIAVQAQTETAKAAAEAGGSEEIIVTATKREQTLQSTPVAVSVTTAEMLERAQIRDVASLQTVVPSLRVENSATSGASTFYIRGFGNGGTNIGIEPSVGVFIDGVYRSRAAAAIGDFPDVQRIEVLRGPQSTLFGKNASAGVISVVTRAPEFEFGGNAELTYGNYNNVVAKGRVTGPLSDNIAFSLAGGYNRADGYMRDAVLDERSNDRNRWFVRGQLLFRPSDTASIRVIADYDRLDESCCISGGITLGPINPILVALGGQVSPNPISGQYRFNFSNQNRIENYGISVQGDFDVGPGKLTTISSFRRSNNFYDPDGDGTSVDLLQKYTGDNGIETFTQELRYATNLDGPFNVLLGGYYFREKVNMAQELQYGRDFRGFVNALIRSVTGDTLNGGAVEALLGVPQNSFWLAGSGITNVSHLKNTAYSLFGQADLEVTDRLTLTGGISYTNDNKRLGATSVTTDLFSAVELPAALAGLRALQFQPPFQTFPNDVEDGRYDSDKFTYLARAAYEITEKVNAYVSYATGFKASSVNIGFDSRPLPEDRLALIAQGLAVPNLGAGSRAAGPENSRVWELGVKGQWRVAGFNFALFDQSLKGFQSSVFFGTGFRLANAGEQSTRGFEFEGWVRPIDGLTLNGALTYLDARFDSFPNSAAGDLTGKRPAGTPDISATAGATYVLQMNNGDTLTLGGDYHYESKVQINDLIPGYSRTVNMFNASLTYRMQNGLELSAWGRNLSDDRYLVQVFPGVAQPGTVMGYPNMPRTYGLTARYRF